MLSPDPSIGLAIKNYQIIEILGQGGTGRVYRAKHPQIGKQVAIKLLRKDVSQQPDAVQRFFQEARSVNDIHHENVIDILDFGKTKDDEYFLLMEFLEGQSLREAIKNEAPFSEKRVGHIGLQICSALSAAHEKGILHRDLKPDNIFLITRSGRKDFVKILDFGLAKLFTEDPEKASATTSGMVLGTPLYMAPEQALGKPLDQQTDIYALGILLYQMTTGYVPFFDPNPIALASMHVTTNPPPPRQHLPKMNRLLEEVILTCLEKEKEYRYRSMKEVASDLARACDLSFKRYFGYVSEAGEEEEDPFQDERTVITPAPTDEETEDHLNSSLPVPIISKKSRFTRNHVFIGIVSVIILGIFSYFLTSFFSKSSKTVEAKETTQIANTPPPETRAVLPASPPPVLPQSKPVTLEKPDKTPKNTEKTKTKSSEKANPSGKTNTKTNPKKPTKKIKDGVLPGPF